MNLFSFAMGGIFRKIRQKNQKIVPKVFSGFQKWTFIFVHFFVRGCSMAKKRIFCCITIMLWTIFFEEKKCY